MSEDVIPAGPEPSNPDMANWKRVRSCIEHEDALVNHRMSWMWAFNGFLLAAYALVLSRFKELAGSSVRELAQVVLVLIPFLGIMLCISVWQGIRAAMTQIDYLNNWWTGKVGKDEKEHPRLIGHSHPWFNHDRLISHGLPVTMIIAWTALILVQWRILTGAPQGVWIAVLAVIAAFVTYLFGIKQRERGSLAARIEKLPAADRAELEKIVSQREHEIKGRNEAKGA